MLRNFLIPTIAVTWLTLVSSGAAQAQGPQFKQLCDERSSYVRIRFTINDGHVALRLSQNMDWPKRTTPKETIKIESSAGQGKLHYRWTAPDEALSIEVAAFGETLQVKHEPRGKSTLVPVELCQAPEGTLALTVGAGDKRRTFHARSVWQLAIAQPNECRQHLFPLLSTLRNNWNLAETVAKVEASLLQGAAEDIAGQRVRFAALVEQLGDEQFAKREAADRALRAGGMAALSYLRQVDTGRLDVEQQFRLRRILEALSGHEEDDSVMVAAASLAGDPTVWLDLLGRPEIATRQGSAHQLAALLGKPIDIDSAAAPDTQREKREKLRTQLEKK
jgi:hypothetical protein